MIDIARTYFFFFGKHLKICLKRISIKICIRYTRYDDSDDNWLIVSFHSYVFFFFEELYRTRHILRTNSNNNCIVTFVLDQCFMVGKIFQVDSRRYVSLVKKIIREQRKLLFFQENICAFNKTYAIVLRTDLTN